MNQSPIASLITVMMTLNQLSYHFCLCVNVGFYGYDFIMILSTQSSFMIMANYAYLICIVKGHNTKIAFDVMALHENVQNSNFPLNT